MKNIAAINTDQNDGLDVQKIIKHGLIALSLAIIVLSCVALWTIIQLTGFYNNKVNVLSKQNHDLHIMRVTSRERILLSYKMISEKDHFKKDADRMTIYSSGTAFALARQNLLKYPLEENESRLLNEQRKLAQILVPVQDEVLDLIFEEKNDTALTLIHNHLIPNQVKVKEVLDELSLSIEKRYKNVLIKADSLSHASIIILISIVIAILLGTLYIFRQTTSRSSLLLSRLSETREMLQDTLYELIQQKDALDHHAIVSIADRQGNITYINDKFCEVSGYERNELIGNNHRILKSDIHPKEFYRDLWETISSGKVWNGKICNKRKNGSYYWVESTISPYLDDKGIPFQYVSIRTDITELFESKIKAEEASSAKSIFLSSMSHELRTPMNAIIGFTQLLEMELKDDRLQSYVSEIDNASNHLLDVINEILDLAQIESGKLVLATDDYSLKSIIEFCLKIIKPSAYNRLIQIENRVDALPDIKIHVDERRIKQVIINLLSNAVKYNTEKGKLIIDYSIEKNHMLKLTIEDTGKGITSEQKNHIFSPFDRAGKENYNIAGSGLGLVISKNLIESMKGSIGFESTINEGTIFWIMIPLQPE